MTYLAEWEALVAARPPRPGPAPKHPYERALTKVDQSDPAVCWPWLGHLDEHGYGVFELFQQPRRVVQAHRVVYEALVGPIPEGLVLDHICRNTPCCNPFSGHHEAVTQKINMERGEWASKTHCPAEHPYDEENTYVRSDGTRVCRRCRREKMRESYWAVTP